MNYKLKKIYHKDISILNLNLELENELRECGICTINRLYSILLCEKNVCEILFLKYNESYNDIFYKCESNLTSEEITSFNEQYDEIKNEQFFGGALVKTTQNKILN